PRLRELPVAEPVPGDALVPHDVRDGLAALLPQRLDQGLGLADHVGVVGAAETAVAGDDQDRAAVVGRLLLQERVVDPDVVAHQRAQRLRDLVGVGLGRRDRLLSLDDPRGRDHLLGARDLGGRLDRPDPLPELTKLCGHGRQSFLTRVIVSCLTSSSAIGSTGSSPRTTPSLVWKPFLNSVMAFFRVARPSSLSWPVSRMEVSRPLSSRCSSSRNSRSKRRMSPTGTSSSSPEVPAHTDTTSSSTGNGLPCGCFSSSTRRAPRSSWARDAASRSDANAANASRSRYCDSARRSVPATFF